MGSGFGMLLTFGIGVVAGLRTMTAPAVVAWAAHLGWINLAGSHFSFMRSVWAVALLSFGALAEYVADLLPSTPSRTDAGPLTIRVVMGVVTGACLGIAGGVSPTLGALLGGLGSLAG